MANKSGGNPLSARAPVFLSLMRDHRDPARPQRPSRIPLETARMASEIRWLALSDGLRFCLRLPREDPRFEEELKRVLERAEQSGVLSVDDVELLEAAAAGSTLDLWSLADSVVERARRQLRVPSARLLRRDPSRTRARPQTRPAARLLVVAAAAGIALAVSVVGARGDSWPDRTPALTPARSAHPPSLAQSPNRCPIPAPLRDAFVTAARRTQLPLPLLVAVARSESHFDDEARSSAGALGVLQLMPSTARAMGADPRDPVANVLAGARYLRSLISRFGSTKLALAAYNAGPTTVATRGALDPPTRAYVAKVTRTWRSVGRCR